MTLAAEALNKMQSDSLDKKMKQHLEAKQHWHATTQGMVMDSLHKHIAAKQCEQMELASKARPAVKLEPMIKLEPAAKLEDNLQPPAAKGRFLQRVGASRKKVGEGIKKKKKLDISKSRGSVSLQMSQGQNCL